MDRISHNISVLIFLLTFLSLIIFPKITLYGQINNLRFDHLSIEDGLPNNKFNCLIQDHLGFIWIGTDNGLSKYDGYGFVNYYHIEKDSSGLINREVNCLMEDSNGDIWVGTIGGLSILLRDEDRFISYKYINNDPTPQSNRISKIYEDKKGNIWIGTWRGGLYFADRKSLLNKKKGLIFRLMANPQYIHPNFGERTVNIQDILVDPENIIWACTTNGLLKITDGKPELIQLIPGKIYNKLNSFLKIIYDKKGSIWLTTRAKGVALFNKNTNEFNFFIDNNLPLNIERLFTQMSSLLLDSKGNLWAGAGALFLFNRQSKGYKRILHDPLNPNSISRDYGRDYTMFTSITEDSFGNIWFTLYDDKINKINLQHSFIKYYRDYLGTENSILFMDKTRMLEARDGRLWFASENGLFEYLSKEKGFIKIIADNEKDSCSLDKRCWEIAEDIKGNLWIGGTFDELRQYNPNTGLLRCFNKVINSLDIRRNVTSILPDRDGSIWFGTAYEGLNKFNTKTNEFVNYKNIPNDSSSISNDRIATMCEDSSNSIWISTADYCLNKFDKETNKVKRMSFSGNDGLFYDLFVDKKKRIWAGTTLGGIYLFNAENDDYRRITTDHGLPSNINLTGFSEDHKGNIYCCSRKYLIKFNRNGDLKDYYKIATNDEVLHQTCYVKKTKEVFVISDKGFYRFFADSLKPNSIPPKMVLTDLKLQGKQTKVGEDSPLKVHINVADKIELDYWQNDLTIQYAGLYYNNQHENKYKYILENYDGNWRDVGTNREVSFTNLDPGKYTFKVLGCNYNGTWATEPATLAITILPPWWITWWAYLIYSLTFLGILYFLYHQQRKRLRVIHRLEMKEFETGKLKEVDHLKSKFFENISHEFRTPLTLIHGPVKDIINKTKDLKIKDNAEIIKRNSNRLYALVNQLLDLSKLETGKMKLEASEQNIIPILKGILLSFTSFAKRKKITLKINTMEENLSVFIDREKVEKIITNLISNAIKFTHEGENNKVTVSVAKVVGNEKRFSADGQSIEITVADTGTGIPAEHLEKIFDRFYQVNDSLTREQYGSGIGLALTKELVELHRGEISVYSEPGQGTRFVVRLPMGKEHLLETEFVSDKDLERNNQNSFLPIDNEIIESEQVAFAIDPETDHDTNINENSTIILVVEDNFDVRKYIREQLLSSFLVLEAGDGTEGIKKAREFLPDLIISDVMMPKMDGYELCRILKNEELTSHIPILLLTAKATSEGKLEGLETGADDYIFKPFDSKELLARVENLIDIRKKLRERYSHELILKPGDISINSMDEIFLLRIKEVVEDHLGDEEFNIKQLRSEVGMSQTQLYRKLRSLTNQSPSQFIRSMRLQRAVEFLKKKKGTVAEIAYMVGFGSQSYFTKCFHEQFGCSPKEYQKNNY